REDFEHAFVIGVVPEVIPANNESQHDESNDESIRESICESMHWTNICRGVNALINLAGKTEPELEPEPESESESLSIETAVDYLKKALTYFKDKKQERLKKFTAEFINEKTTGLKVVLEEDKVFVTNPTDVIQAAVDQLKFMTSKHKALSDELQANGVALCPTPDKANVSQKSRFTDGPELICYKVIKHWKDTSDDLSNELQNLVKNLLDDDHKIPNRNELLKNLHDKNGRNTALTAVFKYWRSLSTENENLTQSLKALSTSTKTLSEKLESSVNLMKSIAYPASDVANTLKDTLRDQRFQMVTSNKTVIESNEIIELAGNLLDVLSKTCDHAFSDYVSAVSALTECINRCDRIKEPVFNAMVQVKLKGTESVDTLAEKTLDLLIPFIQFSDEVLGKYETLKEQVLVCCQVLDSKLVEEVDSAVMVAQTPPLSVLAQFLANQTSAVQISGGTEEPNKLLNQLLSLRDANFRESLRQVTKPEDLQTFKYLLHQDAIIASIDTTTIWTSKALNDSNVRELAEKCAKKFSAIFKQNEENLNNVTNEVQGRAKIYKDAIMKRADASTWKESESLKRCLNNVREATVNSEEARNSLFQNVESILDALDSMKNTADGKVVSLESENKTLNADKLKLKDEITALERSIEMLKSDLQKKNDELQDYIRSYEEGLVVLLKRATSLSNISRDLMKSRERMSDDCNRMAMYVESLMNMLLYQNKPWWSNTPLAVYFDNREEMLKEGRKIIKAAIKQFYRPQHGCCRHPTVEDQQSVSQLFGKFNFDACCRCNTGFDMNLLNQKNHSANSPGIIVRSTNMVKTWCIKVPVYVKTVKEATGKTDFTLSAIPSANATVKWAKDQQDAVVLAMVELDIDCKGRTKIEGETAETNYKHPTHRRVVCTHCLQRFFTESAKTVGKQEQYWRAVKLEVKQLMLMSENARFDLEGTEEETKKPEVDNSDFETKIPTVKEIADLIDTTIKEVYVDKQTESNAITVEDDSQASPQSSNETPPQIAPTE
ncbi:hypothetical protein HDU99_007452, partial [Rhizoclosmatium hyalinum]